MLKVLNSISKSKVFHRNCLPVHAIEYKFSFSGPGMLHHIANHCITSYILGCFVTGRNIVLLLFIVVIDIHAECALRLNVVSY